MEIYRQGDVMLIKTKAPKPKEAKRQKSDNGRVVLAYGEVTGHAHALDAKTSTLYAWDDNRLLVVKEPTALVHEEHTAIPLKPGNYKVIQQREWSVLEQMSRQVKD